jgi:hypothetical protein
MTREQKPLPKPTQHFIRGAREINAAHLAQALGTANLPRGQQITIAGNVAVPIDYTNKTVVLLGLPGCGKTATLHGTQRSLAPVYLARPGRVRQFVIDPAGAYWTVVSATSCM